MLNPAAMATLAKWSVTDYHRMVKTGILQGRRVELLTGDIVEMRPETLNKVNTRNKEFQL